MEVYKLVKKWEDGKLWSYNSLMGESVFSKLEYAVGMVTIPILEGSKLFAIGDRDLAKLALRNSSDSCYLYIAESPDMEILEYCDVRLGYTFKEISYWWKNYRAGKLRKGVPYIRGTVFCSSIKLIEEVHVGRGI